MTNENITARPDIFPWMHPEVQHVRNNAVAYLTELHESLPSFGQIDPRKAVLLRGGIISACYMVPDSDERRVAKFSTRNVPSEGNTLSNWHSIGVNVPKVFDFGIVPSTEGSGIPVSYTLMEAVVDESGAAAPTADEIVAENPTLATVFGRQIGRKLARIHQVPPLSDIIGSENVIGEFNNTAESWNGYIVSEIESYMDQLRGLGYSQQRIDMLISTINVIDFGNQLTNLHNDPVLRNTLVPRIDPIEAYMIDPNVSVGDKHWDFAHLANKTEVERRKAEVNSDQNQKAYGIASDFYKSARASYEEETGQQLDETLLLVCQLPRSIKRYAWFKQKASLQAGSQEKVEASVDAAILRDQVNKVLSL